MSRGLRRARVVFGAWIAVAITTRVTHLDWPLRGYEIDLAWGYVYLELRRWTGRSRRLCAPLALAIPSAVEIAQRWLPLGTFDWWDFLAYATGVTVAVLLEAAFSRCSDPATAGPPAPTTEEATIDDGRSSS